MSEVGSSIWMSTPARMAEAERPEIVDAVRVVGVRMGDQHAVEPLDAGVDQLLAQIGRGVDERQWSRRSGPCARPAPSSGGGGCAGWPDRRRPSPARRAARRPEEPQPRMVRRRLNGARLRPAPSLAKTRSVLARVASASASGAMPCAPASARAVATTKAGSLRLPRCGTRREIGRVGLDQQPVERDVARDGAQVAEFLKVSTPENEIEEPEAQARLGERARRGEAMEERAEPPLPHLLAEDRGRCPPRRRAYG